MAGLFAGSDDQNRGFRRIVYSLIALVIVPTALLLVLGIVMLVFYEARLNVLFGILLMTLVVCLVTGTVLALVFVRREAKLSKLQLDFVSKVSHELRTPLTSIRMFVETLQYEQDEERVATCLSVLQTETSRLSERIERLLDWGRMEAGRRVYDLLPESVDRVVEQAVADFHSATMGQQRKVDVQVAPGLPTLLIDRAAVIDSLVNLLTNAHKYSDPDDPIVVEVRGEGPEVWISVCDTGIGIDIQEHKYIFEKFYRVDDRLSRKVEGSGLGLSIVQHVAIAHRGAIEVESERGHGSTFTLKLPLPPAGSLPTLSSSRPPTSVPAPKAAAASPTAGGSD